LFIIKVSLKDFIVSQKYFILICLFPLFANSETTINRNTNDPEASSCQELFSRYDCQTLIDASPQGERSHFLDCTRESSTNLANATNCSASFLVSASIGYLIVAAPQVSLPVIGGLLLFNAVRSDQECYNDMEYKLRLVRPLAAIHDQSYANNLAARLSCTALQDIVFRTVRLRLGEIESKRIQQERFEHALSQRPDRRESIERQFPETTRILNSNEQALLDVLEEIRTEEETIRSTVSLINQRYRCASESRKIELLCGVAGMISGPGAMARISRQLPGHSRSGTAVTIPNATIEGSVGIVWFPSRMHAELRVGDRVYSTIWSTNPGRSVEAVRRGGQSGSLPASYHFGIRVTPAELQRLERLVQPNTSTGLRTCIGSACYLLRQATGDNIVPPPLNQFPSVTAAILV
jgi:hypothetical protein